MTSIRFLILTSIYVIGHYFIKFHSKNQYADKTIFEIPLFLFSLSTFIFFLVIKTNDNNKCTKNKLESKYIYSQSLFYTIIAILSQNLYQFFLEKECIGIISNTIQSIDKFTYILEALFVAGFVLLTNNISYLIYPKCN
jgi:hypothetical protein